MQIITVISFVIVLFTSVIFSRAQERVILDWANAPANEPPPAWIKSVKISRASDLGIKVADSTSIPPTPFSEHRPSLHVDADSKSRVQIVTMPFSSPVLKGWIEIEAVLDRDNLAIELGTQAQTLLMEGSNKAYDGKTLLRLLVRPNERLLIIPTEYVPDKTSLSPSTDAGAPVQVRIIWDFTAATPYFEFQINGEPAWVEEGVPYRLKLPKEVAGYGVDGIRAFPRDGFFGNIKSSE